MRSVVHFVGFKDDRYWAAVKVWGPPHYVHYGYDRWAQQEIAEGDTVVFANGAHDQVPKPRGYPDLFE